MKDLSYAAALRAARERAGLTQVQLAERAGLTQRQISGYEAGENVAGGVILVRLADALGVSTDALLGRGTAPLTASPDPEARP